MPITGRTLAGGGLMGLGEGLQAYAAQGVRRRQLADEQAFELYKLGIQEANKRSDAAAALAGKREDATAAARGKLLTDVLANTQNAAGVLELAPQMPGLQGVDLEPIRKAVAEQGVRQFLQRMGTLAKPEDAPADMGAALSRQTGQNYGTTGPTVPGVDAAQWGGEAPESGLPPALQQAMQVRDARLADLQKAEEDKLAYQQRLKRAEAYGTGLGTSAATHENAPTALSDKLTAETALGPTQATNAGLVAGAQADAARDPARVQSRINEDLAKKAGEAAITNQYQTPTILYDTQGNAVPLRFGPQGTQVVPGLAPGLTKTAPPQPRKLVATEVDKLAQLNNAEVEGVKVLDLLQKTGLDQSNDPADPRLRNFMLTQIKIAPEDYNKMDITQRTAAVQAILMRGLMGGRPSQYIAEIIKPHLPDVNMSGKLLFHIMDNVLGQTGQLRSEMEHLSGHQPGSFNPTSGQTYQQRRAQQDQAAASAREKLRLRNAAKQ